MKRIFLTILLTSITASLALAAWNDNFQATYQSEGIDKAVIAALEEGIDPNSIIVAGQALEGLNPRIFSKLFIVREPMETTLVRPPWIMGYRN